MKILYALSVVSFLALLWAVYAMTRHVRRSVPLEHDPAAIDETLPASSPSPSTKVPPARRSA